MRRVAPVWIPLVIALAFPSLGASCDDGEEETVDGPEAEPTAGGERVEELPQVDLARLTASEKGVWLDLVNDVLSPCGEPVSVARCVAESRECAACLPAANYLVRLVTEGYETSEIEELYAVRYGPDAQKEIPLEDSPVRGAPMAPVTIVEFSDFECPYCGAAQTVLHRLLQEHEGQVRLVFKHYPLPAHEHAMAAARATEAARKQGKFWEMHDLLFQNQQALQQEDLERYAEQLGLDLERFREDLQSEEIQRKVEADKALGRELGIEGTPTFFINGRRFQEPPRALPVYVEEALRAQ